LQGFGAISVLVTKLKGLGGAALCAQDFVAHCHE
jgi:hypothetical protein